MTQTAELASPGIQPVATLVEQGPYTEAWYLHFTDPANQRAFWLRFNVLVSSNGFRRIAEAWAVYFQRGTGREVNKVALKQTFDIQKFSRAESGITLGECEFNGERTRGSLQAKGKTIRWDLAFRPERKASFELMPDALKRAKLVKASITTEAEDLRVSGVTEVDGEKVHWQESPGMQGHLRASAPGHSWTWGQANTFVNEQGMPAPFLFEGLTARGQLFGAIPTPKLSSFYFFYKDQHYAFNSLWDAFRIRSRNTATEWTFQADHQDISFRGQAKAKHKDFAGLTFEDTRGSLLYCAISKLADLSIHVYRRGKLEATFRADGSASFEVVTRTRNPYVEFLV